jgi:hypothetical protein
MVNNMNLIINLPQDQDLLVPFSNGSKWGVMLIKAIEIVPCIYNEVGEFVEGFAIVQRDGRKGLINEAGFEVLPCKYDIIEFYCGGFARVAFDSSIKTRRGVQRWGFIDKSCNEIVPCMYDQSIDFVDGYASVCLNHYWGIIDITGKTIIPFKYQYASPIQNGFIAVQLNNKMGVIDIQEKIQIEFKYDRIILDKIENLLKFKTGDKWGIIDIDENIVLPAYYESVEVISNDLFKVRLNNNYGLVQMPKERIIRLDLVGITEEIIDNNTFYSLQLEDPISFVPFVEDFTGKNENNSFGVLDVLEAKIMRSHIDGDLKFDHDDSTGSIETSNFVLHATSNEEVWLTPINTSYVVIIVPYICRSLKVRFENEIKVSINGSEFLYPSEFKYQEKEIILKKRTSLNPIINRLLNR